MTVHDLSAWTDGTTERMRQEADHDCIACPTSVRNLMATAHNALAQWDANQGGLPDWSRLARKMETLRLALATVQPVADQHFEALHGWQRP